MMVGGSFAPFGREAADLNGDGLTDVIRNYSGGSNDARLNTGAGWTSAQSDFLSPFTLGVSSAPAGVALMDINSDGLVDLV